MEIEFRVEISRDEIQSFQEMVALHSSDCVEIASGDLATVAVVIGIVSGSITIVDGIYRWAGGGKTVIVIPNNGDRVNIKNEDAETVKKIVLS